VDDSLRELCFVFFFSSLAFFCIVLYTDTESVFNYGAEGSNSPQHYVPRTARFSYCRGGRQRLYVNHFHYAGCAV
jgi:hypothetical protein